MRDGPLFGFAFFAGAGLCCALAMPALGRNAALVGTWAPVETDCAVTAAVVRITGRDLVAHDAVCTLTPAGPDQIAAGRCNTLGNVPSPTVAVGRSGRHLTLAYDGGAAVHYHRCHKP